MNKYWKNEIKVSLILGLTLFIAIECILFLSTIVLWTIFYYETPLNELLALCFQNGMIAGMSIWAYHLFILIACFVFGFFSD